MSRPMSFDAANEYLNRRLHAVTTLGSKAISADVPARVRANVFFSARVAEDHIAARLRAVSDEFSAGRINLAEARSRLKAFLADDGHAPGGVGSPPDGVDPQRWRVAQKLANLASTARLNLILRQNAAQAQAVGHWQVGQDANIKRRWPCWRYIALPGARNSHAALNNKVFRKDDPVWHRIFPPWEFNCRCQVEDCDEEEAEAYGGVSVAASYPDAPASGYEFDPAEAFGNLDLSRIDRLETRRKRYLEIAELCDRDGAEATLFASAASGRAVNKPGNIAEIRAALTRVKAEYDAAKSAGRAPTYPSINVSMGRLNQAHADAIGLPTDEVALRYVSPGASRYGPVHWDNHHADTMDPATAEDLFGRTVWSPEAAVRIVVKGRSKRLVFTEKNGTAQATFFKAGDGWEFRSVDAWEIPKKQ